MVRGRLLEGEPMSRHTSLRVGGPARMMLLARDVDDVVAATSWAREEDWPCLVIGLGTNLLVSDQGFPGLVVKTHPGLGQTVWEEESVRVEAGSSLASLAREAIGRGRAGLEFAVGIPGTVGGALVGNAGAHGHSLGELVLEAEVLTDQGERRTWPPGKLEFGYRTSSLQRLAAVVLSVRLRLGHEERDRLRARAEEFLRRRRRSQPLGQPSAGCVFRNPPGRSAGELLDRCGLKGMKRGGAEVSSVHANFIINRGGATAADVLELMRRMREAVCQRFGVLLEPEVRTVGFEEPVW